MKRTNVVLDERVVKDCKRLTGIQTTRGVVDHALRELRRIRRQRRILGLEGKVNWRGDLARLRRGRRLP
jgi:Arc/MetJ family transcription regulator